MSHDDFNFEPVPGLPEALPKDEYILWQGRPQTWALAREALMVHWVAIYFAVLFLWRVTVSTTLVPWPEALLHGVPFLVAGAIACGILLVIAWMQARSTIYTLTNKRVAMRIGAALTMTLNLPYVRIASASLDRRRGGTGTIAFSLLGDTKLSYLMTWPHVRPWRMARPEPALRCIPEVDKVARIFAEAAEARVSEPKLSVVGPADAVAAE